MCDCSLNHTQLINMKVTIFLKSNHAKVNIWNWSLDADTFWIWFSRRKLSTAKFGISVLLKISKWCHYSSKNARFKIIGILRLESDSECNAECNSRNWDHNLRLPNLHSILQATRWKQMKLIFLRKNKKIRILICSLITKLNFVISQNVLTQHISWQEILQLHTNTNITITH